MAQNDKRPRAREKEVTGEGKELRKRGEALGTGRVGSKPVSQSSAADTGHSGGGMKRAAVGGGGGIAILALLAMLVFGKGGGLGSLLGGGGGGTEDDASNGTYSATGATSVDNSVASGSREKRTVIKGNNQDIINIMVYTCGTDLESKYGMATNDMEEMRQASSKFGDKINLIVYTGGCKSWKSKSVNISSSKNQIYQIKDGKITCLENDMGNKVMTDPATLTEFIKYCNNNFGNANRNELILWDHGGGSVSGYGYDEKNANKGSMSLAGVSQALKNAGVKFDFIGYDACLMATAENALMLDDYADYLIASEETEPGIGWYYTDWLKKLADNTSMPTLEIGKNIIDDFVTKCAEQCRGQKTTLSIIDLAEFKGTVPDDLKAFSKSISSKISNEDYKSVSDARYNTREFATSSRIDQVDLVDLALKMDTAEGKELSESLRSAVKYNRTSTNMTDAYGVSIYFPYQRTSYVDSACSTYNQIGMDSDYAKCIRQFASLETSGQIAAGGSNTSSPIGSLFGTFLSSGAGGGTDMIGSLLSGFLGGDRNIPGLDSSNTEFMNDQDINTAAEYIDANHLDPSQLTWSTDNDTYTLKLTEEQWDMVHLIDRSMFYDDGEGYVDLGLDNTFSWTDDDTALVADTGRDWLAINGQPVAYYHTDTIEYEDDYSINGYVPCELNGERANLIIVFDQDNPDGYIAGAVTDYINGETDTIAKNMTELNVGDTIDFVYDYYDYDGNYQDSYHFADPMTVTDNMQISNVTLGSGECRIMYCFTDIYNQVYWSEAISR